MKDYTRVYIGIGSNLGDPGEYVRTGIAALRRLDDSRLVACSSLYRTAPIGVADQPDFINAVCALDTRMSPEVLLRRLFLVEQSHGRVRGPIRGGARTLDLDLLLYGDLQLTSARVTIPHPRLHQRAFVLVPLLEIAPGLRIPGGQPAAEHLRLCAAQAVARIADEQTIAP